MWGGPLNIWFDEWKFFDNKSHSVAKIEIIVRSIANKIMPQRKCGCGCMWKILCVHFIALFNECAGIYRLNIENVRSYWWNWSSMKNAKIMWQKKNRMPKNPDWMNEWVSGWMMISVALTSINTQLHSHSYEAPANSVCVSLISIPYNSTVGCLFK